MTIKKLFEGKDESHNRIDINILTTHKQWNINKSQTYHANQRIEDEQLQKELTKEKAWVTSRLKEINGQISNTMGSHWPKWTNKFIKNWTDADFADLRLQCQQKIQTEHPGINVNSTMINQLFTKVLTLTTQRDRMAMMLSCVQAWLQQDAKWRQKTRQSLRIVMANLHDEDATETTQAIPKKSTSTFNQIRNFDAQVLKKLLQAQQRQNLQRYRIRAVIEKSLIAPSPNNRSTHSKSIEESKDDGLEF